VRQNLAQPVRAGKCSKENPERRAPTPRPHLSPLRPPHLPSGCRGGLHVRPFCSCRAQHTIIAASWVQERPFMAAKVVQTRRSLAGRPPLSSCSAGLEPGIFGCGQGGAASTSQNPVSGQVRALVRLPDLSGVGATDSVGYPTDSNPPSQLD
jgi:hypothetical protein